MDVRVYSYMGARGHETRMHSVYSRMHGGMSNIGGLKIHIQGVVCPNISGGNLETLQHP